MTYIRESALFRSRGGLGVEEATEFLVAMGAAILDRDGAMPSGWRAEQVLEFCLYAYDRGLMDESFEIACRMFERAEEAGIVAASLAEDEVPFGPNPWLWVAVREAVMNQLGGEGPPEVAAAEARLVAKGLTREEAREKIGSVLAPFIHGVMAGAKPFDRDGYVARLARLG